MGRYLWSIKWWILSDVGYVLNEDVVLVMIDVIGDEMFCIYLVYLSQDNNMKELVRMFVQQILVLKGFLMGEIFDLYDIDLKKVILFCVV